MAKRFTHAFLAAAVALLVAAPMFTEAGATATASTNVRSLKSMTSGNPPTKPVCAAVPRQGDIAEGIDLITDLSCTAGEVGCLGVSCRYCMRWETKHSRGLVSCASIEARSNAATQLAVAVEANTKSEGTSVGLNTVGTSGSKAFEFSVVIALCVAGTVAVLAFATTKLVQRRRRNREMMATPTSLAQYRASVFEI